jgi:hypothetical protein
MKLESTYEVSMENRTLVSEIVPDEVVNKIITGWKDEYGDILDFGGGIKDVTCFALLELSKGKHAELKKLFPLLTTAEAKYIIAESEKVIKTEV